MTTPGGLVHDLTMRRIFRRALELKREGRLFPPGIPYYENTFKGSIERFCEIAFRLRGCGRILDVGAGGGILVSLLTELGHECRAVDFGEMPQIASWIYLGKNIEFKVCNVEVDDLPYPDESFDGVTCCQVLEHFTHSHLRPMKEMGRVLRAGGIIEVDVPNAVCMRNRSRMIRGKHITWDYKQHYLHTAPVLYKGMSFFPHRHNREFTKKELEALLAEAGFRRLDVHYLKSTRYRTGFDRINTIGAHIKDIIPSFRKSIIAFGEKI